ncbi:GNAT family N-acetyltransferase (plasmid) [Methylobacterium sp. NMS14P]|uniref:GNAT family N-acetyltransferase n=1 Tax=Methylobacterium sp. NMS14P TaxID=2894310 RepID=UPI002358E152|nr:GNAT family N-acetyltransferase [Methylobacterium sp. NMS14P]WCS28727.1 GNAT family N-acetyltransferase [Methylobacterium sp. NMS14P]
MSDQMVFTTPLDPLARPLLDQLTREYLTRYGRPVGDLPGAAMKRDPAELLAPPDGNFVLLLRDGRAIAGGAFKRHDPYTAELKRVWTDAALRRQGLARQIVETLETQAKRQGYDRICLTTGFREPEARELYLQLGYTPRFDVAVDPEIFRLLPFEKVLRPKVVPLRRPPGHRPIRHAS